MSEDHDSGTMLDAATAAEIQNAERLARQLIRHLGVSGAQKTCRENHWDGVLSAVEAQARSRSGS